MPQSFSSRASESRKVTFSETLEREESPSVEDEDEVVEVTDQIPRDEGPLQEEGG